MKSLRDALLYGIIDLGYIAPSQVEYFAEELCSGGVDLVQLRAKCLSDLEVEELGQRIMPITEGAGVPLIINDFPELVPALGAQGAHVGQSDLSIYDARWRAGRALGPGDWTPPIIGRSTHSVQQAVEAAEQAADYIGFGPLFATATKPGRPAIGLEAIAEVHRLVEIPIFCIGGIKLENLPDVIAAGARRVVIVSGILQSVQPSQYCRVAREMLLNAPR